MTTQTRLKSTRIDQIKQIEPHKLYERYCSVCDASGVEHPPKSTPHNELIKMIITTPTLQGGQIKKMLSNPTSNFMNQWIHRVNGGGALSKKQFPENYQRATQHLIDIIAFDPKKVRIQGTMSYKAYLYPSDYDLFETVSIKDLSTITKEFQHKIKTLLSFNDVFIGDIKAGEYEPLKIINERAYFKNGRVVGYDYKETIERLQSLLDSQYITRSTFNKLKKLIKQKPTQSQWNIMVKNLRLHVLRWTPQDILKGYLPFLKHRVTLEQALQTMGLFKLDVIAYINNKFSEFSIIYDLRNQGKRINNFKININEDLKNNILQLQDNEQYFKMLKRILSLMRVKMKHLKADKDKVIVSKEIETITSVLNGELGILNSVANDIDIIEQIINNEQNTPMVKIKEQIDNFIYRLSNIYETQQYLKHEKQIINLIHSALRIKSKTTLLKTLDKIRKKLLDILNKKAKYTALNYAGLF